jgi:tetratricopeptide (TPR) repeat protein
MKKTSASQRSVPPPRASPSDDDGSEDSASSSAASDAESETDYAQLDDAGQLAVRCRIDRRFGISREVGQQWFDAARYGDMKVVRRLLRDGQAAAEQGVAAALGGGGKQPRRPRRGDALALVHYNGQSTTYGFVGSTALHWACANGDVPMATLLLQHGAAPNAPNHGGSTPLHSACGHGRSEMVALLLGNGATPSVVDCCGDTPADVIAPGDMSEARQIVSLLTAHNVAAALVGSAPAAWRPADMKAVLLAAGEIESFDAAPLEREALVAATAGALPSFTALRDAAATYDGQAARLHRQSAKWVLRQRAKMAARRDDDDDDGGGAIDIGLVGAEQAKAKGNDAFQAGDMKVAVKYYSSAIAVDATNATYLSNRAAAYMHMEMYPRALEDARRAVALRPAWAKAHHRVGTAAYALGRFGEAIDAFRAGLKVEPADEALLSGFRKSSEAASAELDAQEARDDAPYGSSDDDDDDDDDDDRARPPPPVQEAAAAAAAFVPLERRTPWFECALCDNRTRDRVVTPCCRRELCGTCMVRRGADGCPFRCSS